MVLLLVNPQPVRDSRTYEYSVGGRNTSNILRAERARTMASVKMPFGKHRGKRLISIPTEYLVWLRDENEDLDAELRKAVDHELSRRDDVPPPPGGEPPPEATPVAGASKTQPRSAGRAAASKTQPQPP